MGKITPDIIKQHNLTDSEYQQILSILGREPNLVELGIFSVMWSEHCSYKSSRKHLKNFPTSGPQVIQGPGENAGVVDIGDGDALCFKMESHNHPSFIEPYQGAATGVGGILRDVFTMGARPIANLNSLRFGATTHPKTAFLVDGVVAGIAGYGNCMGIPTVGGEVYFDESYNGNILVNAMTVGLVKKDKIFKGYASGVGNPVLYLGSKTGRDGIHGATMASDSFDDESEQKRPTVQVGDPFTEKRLLEACLELMSKDIIVGIQDMGAAGLTSSSFEMASRAGTGIELDLNKVPLREPGMTPYEMMLSESQERMLLVCKKGCEDQAIEIFKKWDLDCEVIGQVTDTGRYVASFNNEEVVNVPIDPLAEAAPVYDRPQAEPQNYRDNLKLDINELPEPSDFQSAFLNVLSHPNHASKKWVYQQYDHQVMTNSVILPGSDASVLRLKGSSKGVAFTANVNSRYCYLDPQVGARIAVAESGRNLVCSGAQPLAITDCLNFGNPENPEIMWQFTQAVKGMSEACTFFNTPVVSGNVSFYNETNGESIYPTPTVGMVGLLNDIEKRCDQFFKQEGDVIILLGETKAELGGSEYLKIHHQLVKGAPPELDLGTEKKLWDCVLKLIDGGHLASAHDLSEGGLAMALAESSFNPQEVFGFEVSLEGSLRSDVELFSESQSRVLVSASESDLSRLNQVAQEYGVSVKVLGRVGGDQMVIKNHQAQNLIVLDKQQVCQQWQTGFEKGIFTSCAAS